MRHTIKEKGSQIRLKFYLNKVAVIGGDNRQGYLAEILQKSGYEVKTYAVNCVHGEKSNSLKMALADSAIIAAPIPFLKNGEVFSEEKKEDLSLEGILEYAPVGCQIFAGGIPASFSKEAQKKEIVCMDYLKDCHVVMQNTIAVAEGALSEAMRKSNRNLYKSNCIVLGYGKCGSTLTSYLKRMGCHVIVYEKEKELKARAALVADEIMEKDKIPLFLQRAHYIFNTIPAMILPKARLEYVSQDTLILDLSSSPGGVDFKWAQEKGIQAVLLPGIPGKYAPKSSAEILGEMIKREGKRK